MFTELQMELDCDTLGIRQSSNLHGFIMETIRTEYAEYLHQLKINPFSQCLIISKYKKVWYIRLCSGLMNLT